MKIIRKPIVDKILIIPSKPKSGRKTEKTLTRYKTIIRNEAKKKFKKPLKSKGIQIDIFYGYSNSKIPDTDNISKPILDAFKGIVYLDDNQVSFLRVCLIDVNRAATFPSVSLHNVEIPHAVYANKLAILIRLFKKQSVVVD